MENILVYPNRFLSSGFSAHLVGHGSLGMLRGSIGAHVSGRGLLCEVDVLPYPLQLMYLVQEQVRLIRYQINCHVVLWTFLLYFTFELLAHS